MGPMDAGPSREPYSSDPILCPDAYHALAIGGLGVQLVSVEDKGGGNGVDEVSSYVLRQCVVGAVRRIGTALVPCVTRSEPMCFSLILFSETRCCLVKYKAK